MRRPAPVAASPHGLDRFTDAVGSPKVRHHVRAGHHSEPPVGELPEKQ